MVPDLIDNFFGWIFERFAPFHPYSVKSQAVDPYDS